MFHSDPGVTSIHSKRISRLSARRKPKRKEEFKAGKKKRWDEFYTGRGKKMEKVHTSRFEGEVYLKNKRADLKVYARRSKCKEKRLDKGKGDMRPVENYSHDNWKEFEEQFIESCKFTNSNSSEYSESDAEVSDFEEVDSEKEREVREEEGYEGMRMLMGMQDNEINVKSTITGVLDDTTNALANSVQLTENSANSVMGSQEMHREVQSIGEGNMVEKSKGPIHDVHIGKVKVSWEEITSASETLNLELIEKNRWMLLIWQ